MLIDPSFLRDRAFRLKRRDAIVLYLALKNATLDSVLSYDSIADALNKVGIETQRGARFTGRVLRALVDEIVKAGLIELDPDEGGGFRIRIVPDPFKGSLLDPPESVFDSDSVTETETETETAVENETPSSRININTNTQEINTNKRAREKNASQNENGNERGAVARRSEKPLVSCALDRVDFGDAEALSIRRKLVSIVWEASLRSELVDRAVAAIKLGLARASEMIGYARRAAEIARQGRKTIWQSFALDVKRAFDQGGYVWNPTRAGAEPAPRIERYKDKDNEEEDGARLYTRGGKTYYRLGVAA